MGDSDMPLASVSPDNHGEEGKERGSGEGARDHQGGADLASDDKYAKDYTADRLASQELSLNRPSRP
jgi:hypothetical protein